MDPKVRSKIKPSTQDHLEILDVIDDLVITKSGSVSLVIQTNAVNFDLLSEYEQDSKIYAFAGLLNSLNFHIQILIKTQRIDIANYIDYLNQQLSRPMSEGLRTQLTVYTSFVQNLIVTNDVLDKKFYLVVPYNPANPLAGAKLKKQKAAANSILSEKHKLQVAEQGRIYLYPKRDHILKQLGRMGLMGHQLENNELIQLFYEVYTPEV
ncbi:MAG: hypothetical protein QY318_02510 [Candidatus Dojkabacteria bacterium]|nr:MAG: hypothetical protein QY318_02510 [Candidatus Dojkabacteria bacterium]